MKNISKGLPKYLQESANIVFDEAKKLWQKNSDGLVANFNF